MMLVVQCSGIAKANNNSKAAVAVAWCSVPLCHPPCRLSLDASFTSGVTAAAVAAAAVVCCLIRKGDNVHGWSRILTNLHADQLW